MFMFILYHISDAFYIQNFIEEYYLP